MSRNPVIEARKNMGLAPVDITPVAPVSKTPSAPTLSVPFIFAFLGPLLASAVFALYLLLSTIALGIVANGDVFFLKSLELVAMTFVISLFVCYPVGAIPAAITGLFFLFYRRHLKSKAFRLFALGLTAALVEVLYLAVVQKQEALISNMIYFSPLAAVAALILGWGFMLRERKYAHA